MIPSLLQSAYNLRRALRNAAIIFAVAFFAGLGLSLGALVALWVGWDWVLR